MNYQFDFSKFTSFYKNIQPMENHLIFYVYDKVGKKPVIGNRPHPLLPNVYITFDTQNKDNFIYFNFPTMIDGILYGHHFSIGEKGVNSFNTSKYLINIHYSLQTPQNSKSYKDKDKCFIYDQKTFNTKTFASERCENKKAYTFGTVYDEILIKYLNVILATPFIASTSDQMFIYDIVDEIKTLIIGGNKNANQKIYNKTPFIYVLKGNQRSVYIDHKQRLYIKTLNKATNKMVYRRIMKYVLKLSEKGSKGKSPLLLKESL